MSAAPAPAARGGTRSADRLRLRTDPVRLLLSASPWRAAGYLISYLVVSCVTFSVALTAATAAVGLAVTVLALPLMIAVAWVVHWCAGAERALLSQVFTEPVRASYARRERAGLWGSATAAWRDRATWRELCYLLGLWAPLYVLDTVVLSVWATFLAGITLPLWYWAPRGTAGLGYTSGTQVHGVAFGYFPHGPAGPGAWGFYVDTLPKALLAAAVFAVAFLLFNYVLVATARMHGRIARALLRPPADPLEEARDVLTRPGPLGPLMRADH
jgi:Putative sensor